MVNNTTTCIQSDIYASKIVREKRPFAKNGTMPTTKKLNHITYDRENNDIFKGYASSVKNCGNDVMAMSLYLSTIPLYLRKTLTSHLSPSHYGTLIITRVSPTTKHGVISEMTFLCVFLPVCASVNSRGLGC